MPGNLGISKNIPRTPLKEKDTTFSLNTNSFSGIFTLFCIAFTFNEILDTLLKFLKEDKYDK